MGTRQIIGAGRVLAVAGLLFGVVAVAALIPAAQAAKGGSGSQNCTSTTYKDIDRKAGTYYEVIDIYCDNPTAGSTDCSAVGDGFGAMSWDAGKRPDYNADGIVCYDQIIIMYV